MKLQHFNKILINENIITYKGQTEIREMGALGKTKERNKAVNQPHRGNVSNVSELN